VVAADGLPCRMWSNACGSNSAQEKEAVRILVPPRCPPKA